MKSMLTLSTLLVVAGAGETHAANFAVITSPPNVLNVLVLLFAGACLAICLQVVSLVKGGLFSKIWQLFSIGFILLAISQLLSLLTVMEVVVIPVFVAPALMVVMAGLFLYGILEAKRILG